jgi:hypothetical protein
MAVILNTKNLKAGRLNGNVLRKIMVGLIKVWPELTLEWVNRVCQILNQINQTNKTDGSFMCAAIGQNRKLYFGSIDEGIWYVDSDDGLVKQTNKTDGSFQCAAMGQKLYFGSIDDGIWYLDSNDGLIKQTNKTDGRFMCAAMNQSGTLYFGSYGGEGVWYVDNDDGLVKQTNKTDGSFYCAAKDQSVTLYFGSYNSSGIWYLDSNDGLIKQTNKTNGSFMCAAIGQDGMLYFGSVGSGVWYVDSDDGLVKQTNKTDGSFQCAVIGQNGKLYFGSYNSVGIWYLDNDGLIKQTNKTDGNFNCAAIGQDGKLYFGSIGSGVWYLDSDGDIKQTDKTDGSFYCAEQAPLQKLYFGAYSGGVSSAASGVWYFDDPLPSGNAIATALLKDDPTAVSEPPVSILGAFGSYAAITESEYMKMSNRETTERAAAFFEYVSDGEKYTEIGSVIEKNVTMCPIRARHYAVFTLYTYLPYYACSTNHDEGDYRYYMYMDFNNNTVFVECEAIPFTWDGVYYPEYNNEEEFLALPKTFFVQRMDALTEYFARYYYPDWIDGYDVLTKPTTPAAVADSSCSIL